VKPGRRGGAEVEVATFRSEHSYQDGRHPVHVAFESDPRLDALRRDFTINALFEDPATGEVLDFTGGRGDLERRVIRAIGDPHQRFSEDYLRMLRAVRLAAALDFEIEPDTMAAIQQKAASIRQVSAERSRDELVRILTEGRARRGFELLDASGLLAHLLPEVLAMKGVEQPREYHPEGDVWIHTLLMLEKLESPSTTLAMGVLLHDVGKCAIEPSLLNKALPLSADEKLLMARHSEFGAQILIQNPKVPPIAVVAAYEHHIHYRGDRGYPRERRVSHPHAVSQMVALADAYDSLRTKKAYRPAHPIASALKLIQNKTGSQFDPFLVANFARVLENFD
jgi:tRNA nucleotidyltransferase/poly(A) polymerase